jgi:predicted transcriptional regulator
MVYDDEDPETAARLDAEAEADIAAGRVVPHEKVVEWLESWGTPNELPCPKP